MTNVTENTVDTIEVAEEVKPVFKTDLDVTVSSNEAIIESMTEVASGKIGLMNAKIIGDIVGDGGNLGIHIANPEGDDFNLVRMNQEEVIEFVKAILKVAAPEMELIESSTLEEFVEESAKLNALEGAGVDNWSGYDYAMELMSNE